MSLMINFIPIAFFLQLLSKPKFSVLEKIKTIGSTYMVAAGLQPGKEGGRSVSILVLISCTKGNTRNINSKTVRIVIYYRAMQ